MKQAVTREELCTELEKLGDVLLVTAFCTSVLWTLA